MAISAQHIARRMILTVCREFAYVSKKMPKPVQRSVERYLAAKQMRVD